MSELRGFRPQTPKRQEGREPCAVRIAWTDPARWCGCKTKTPAEKE